MTVKTGWGAVWERVSDEQLLAALRDYLWLEKSHPTNSSRLLELGHEATRRGKPELIDQARIGISQAGKRRKRRGR